MKHIKPFNLSEDFIPGGRAFSLELEDIAQEHQVPLEDLRKALKVGIKVETEHTPDRAKSREIAMDHLAEDPDYYTKLIKAGIVDEPEALRTYELLYGESVTEGYYDPPDEPEPPDPVAAYDYTPAQQLFEYISSDRNDVALIRKKSDRSYWILDTTDMEYEDDFSGYLFRIHWDDDNSEIDEDLLGETYVNVATDLFKENKWEEGTMENWEDRKVKLFTLTESLANEIFEVYSTFSRRHRRSRYTTELLGDLSRLYPDPTD